MPPTPQIETHPVIQEECTTGGNGQPGLGDEKIIISGISGLYPGAHSVKELSNILYNQENPVTSEGSRWDYKHPELSGFGGKAPDAEQFDAQFFSVYYHLAHHMDPILRKLLEQTYQALYDAGVSPRHLSGKKVGVFVGSSFSDAEKSGFCDTVSKLGLGILGSSKAMFANRISYWLNIKGPSLAFDDSDCSTTSALEQAYLAIRRGDCEAAIVGGAYLCLRPHVYIHHRRLGAMSKDGTTKSFAEDSEGYSLSDTLGILFLQKSKDALRNYAEVVHVKNEYISLLNDNTGPRFGRVRDPKVTANFIKDFYNEAQITPDVVEYVEGYGTGIPDDDKSELEALEEIYCKDNIEPIPIGSVASNIGVTEAASGFSSITKVLLGYYKGELAANLNCENPRKDIAALRDGRMRIVSKNERFDRTYVAINGMSITGINSHVLLRGHYKPKDLSRYNSSMPHLVILSGRQESSVSKIIDDLKSRPVDAEEVALLHNIHSKSISGHLGRGYVILDTDAEKNTVSLHEKVQYFDDARRPLWFVYSGMGSQWAGMGAQLMRIPVFAAAIERCQEVLKPTGLDLIHIITTTDKTIFDNILHSFVGIAAVQIGLTDILRVIGLEPDGIIGHSVGELGCGYADGCLTAEEMILSAYSRGLVSLETPFIRGSMAAVGLGYEQILPMCPPEIDVACHNGPDSSTISGPANVMQEFVSELTSKSIFAKEVPCSNIAYHSRYIAEAGPKLLKRLKEVIKSPKPRSERWLSSSVPQDKWDLTSAKYCSAEYHTNNLLSPVLFEETSRLIPKNAVLVEIAPHGLLQAILKRALSPDCRNVPLTRRGCADGPLLLLQAIGDLYMEGYTPNLHALYPKVDFPVSTETPMLSHLIEWVHGENWTLASYNVEKQKTAAECRFIKSIHDDEYRYYKGHVIRGKMCYPFAAALVAAWDMLAMYMGVPKRDVSVEFHDLYLHAQPLLFEQRPLEITVAMQKGVGRFEIMSQHSKVMSGYMLSNPNKPVKLPSGHNDAKDDITLTAEDLYQLLKDKDYNYSGEFCGIEQASASFDKADLVWNNNWVTLIDSMLQLNVLRQHHHGVSQPVHIRTIDINLKEHVNSNIYQLNGKSVITANVDEIEDSTRCGGIRIEGIQFNNLPAISLSEPLELSISPSRGSIVNGTNAQYDITAKKLTLQSEQIGKLDSLRWVELSDFEKSDVTVTVQFAGLNMLDVNKAAGVKFNDSNTYGMDYSGLSESGDRVMGIVESGAASTHVRALPELLWPVPDHWSLEDAATVPLTYAHAFYALIIRGGLEPGMKVLVHGGTGALGLAVIAISLAYNCEVFATVSDIRKKQFLLKLFPQLGEDHIENSRDESFADNVLIATRGEGCDIIVSCAKGGLKNATFRCSGSYGKFIDTVQIPDRENFEYRMNFLVKERSYLTCDFSSIFKYNNREEMKLLQKLLSDGIAARYVVPLPRVSYAMHDVPRAFSLLGANQHRGKVLLRMIDDKTQVLQRMTLDPAHYQVLFWNDNVIGSRLADKLINQGARKLYVNFSELTTYQRYKIRGWEKLGVKVVVSTEDTKESKSSTAVLNDAIKLGTVEGIFVVITSSSSLSSDLNNLDSVSRLVCPKLRFFTVVSAVKALGQDICLSRAKSGFNATYLDVSSLSNDELKQSGNVVELIERAVCSTHVVLETNKRDAQPVDFLEQLAALAGINIPKNIDPDVTLEQLGVTDKRAQAICEFINSTFNISLENGDLTHFTIEQLNELEKSLTEKVPVTEDGLGSFISYVDSDELVATADLMVLPTLCSDDEYNIDERYLCILPGIEGHHEKFRSLCKRLKMPAFVLQPGLDHLDESARETAQRYAEILLKKTKVQDNFYILGYESGVAVALELAAILEDQGLQGTVFCVGGTPNQIQAEVKRQLHNLKTRTQLENAVLQHVSTIILGEVPDGLEAALQYDTWEQKLDAYIRLLGSNMAFSQQYARAVIEAAIARIERAQQWSTSGRLLRSRLILLGAATSSIQDSATLQQYSQQPVIVHQLESPLSHLLRNMQCPSLINSYLDSDTLDKFNSNNLCEQYQIYSAYSIRM